MSSTYVNPIIELATGRSVDLRNVNPERLMTVGECQEVAAALRQRASSAEARARMQLVDEQARTRAADAARTALGNRNAVLARLRFLSLRGDQHVELMSDAARFMAVARERLGRDVYQAILQEARAMSAAPRINGGGHADAAGNHRLGIGSGGGALRGHRSGP